MTSVLPLSFLFFCLIFCFFRSCFICSFFSFHISYSLVCFTIFSFLCLSYCLFLFLSSFFECAFISVSCIPSVFVFSVILVSVCPTVCAQSWELQLPCSLLRIRTQPSSNINELRKGEPIMVLACFCWFFFFCNSPIKEKAMQDRGAATFEVSCVYCRRR